MKSLTAYETRYMKGSNSADKISATNSFNINYLISHKGFAELFDTPIVAKKK